MKKIKIVLVNLITIFSVVAGFGQINPTFSLPGTLQLETTSFQHGKLLLWLEEHPKIRKQQYRKWGNNPVVDKLLHLDTLGAHEATVSYNRMADQNGMLAFCYYEENSRGLFERSSIVDSTIQLIDRFIKEDFGFGYKGEYSLFIASLDKKGNRIHYQSTISNQPHITMDESTAPKKRWLDSWIQQNKPSLKIKEALRRLDKIPLQKVEEPSESVMEVGLSEDLLPGQIRYGKFDVGYGAFKNLQFGGYLMESLERDDLKGYQAETAPFNKETTRSIRTHKKDFRNLKGGFDTDAPLFTSALQNPAEDWYERTYYSVSLEEGINIVLQIQVTFVENRGQEGFVKKLTVKKKDQANYRDYYRYVLFQKKVAMPLAPVYEMEIDWVRKKTRGKK